MHRHNVYILDILCICAFDKSSRWTWYPKRKVNLGLFIRMIIVLKVRAAVVLSGILIQIYREPDQYYYFCKWSNNFALTLCSYKILSLGQLYTFEML